MKNPGKDNQRELPLIAIAILSLALTLPLLARKTRSQGLLKTRKNFKAEYKFCAPLLPVIRHCALYAHPVFAIKNRGE